MKNELARLKGVGKARLQALEKAGITDAQGLIKRFPREYVFFDEALTVSQMQLGERCLLYAKILSVRPVFARGLSIVTAKLSDGKDTVEAVWFNQPYLRSQLEVGESGFFYGLYASNKGKKQLISPTRFAGSSKGVQPVYAPLQGIQSKVYGNLVRSALDLAMFEEYMPAALLERYGLPNVQSAYESIHFPQSREDLERALSRMAFEDLLLFQLAILGNAKKETGLAMRADFDEVKPLLDLIGFELTNAQKRVLGEIFTDMQSRYPMARLVEGDVGSGKTVLAFAALYACVKNGCQGALMAPTEVLAGQHFEKARELLEPLGVSCAFLTGSITPKERREAYKRIESGEAQLIIGTHALISEGVQYKNLGLIVTDEQHRFGVNQRTKLEKKGSSPHVLVMSATPIPRTMALVLYGDLDISVVDELPPGRQQVITKLVPEGKREGMYGFIRDNAREGGQAYVICPLVEETDAMDAANAVETCEQMKKALPELSIALLHGRMGGKQKQALLNGFADGSVQVLVSTTVIEVGVNVPNATIMVIENAERFGLAQLHQLRGRVGRGRKQSWCFLMADSSERLRTLVNTNDGFVIAQKDLELRGPGEFMGTRQHGLIDKRLLQLAGDGRLMAEVKAAAQEVLQDAKEPQNERLLVYLEYEMQQRGYELARN